MHRGSFKGIINLHIFIVHGMLSYLRSYCNYLPEAKYLFEKNNHAKTESIETKCTINCIPNGHQQECGEYNPETAIAFVFSKCCQIEDFNYHYLALKDHQYILNARWCVACELLAHSCIFWVVEIRSWEASMKKPLSIINDTFCTNGGPMELMLSWMWMGDKQVG